jgi:hypothetical protein
MTDDELNELARTKPAELQQMILSETEAQSDFPMNKQELRNSQSWVARAEAALKEVGWGDT